jgi:hypothetical protein
VKIAVIGAGRTGRPIVERLPGHVDGANGML